ncbi:MAG: hypothetical protein GX108_07150, partial [Thermovirga sp.]|nr:hypothetical protein [Thermovirga sp.]
IERTFIPEASKHVSKSSRPDRLRLGSIPRNFKGALEIKELKRVWLEELAGEESAPLCL